MSHYDNEREKDNDKQEEDELSDLEYMRRLYEKERV